jgi:hydroxymethylpyrimidine/phosphomethylpyrimidine kinase
MGQTPIAVTIAGSDSGGGAGIQADLKTFSALGVYGASVITALTAQNTKGVTAIHDVPAEFVAAQIDAVFSDLDVVAVKIGMVSQGAVIATIAAGLERWKQTKVVLDPVMIATSGDKLLAPDAIGVLKRLLIPRALVVTPNLPEAAALLDAPIARTEAEMRVQGERLLALGPRAVLVKGGHGSGAESVDLLIEPGACTRLAADRIATRNTHGTGCTLSSAIAAGLAKGLDLVEAARAAKTYVTAAIAASSRLEIGSGHGPVHHFHAWWRYIPIRTVQAVVDVGSQLMTVLQDPKVGLDTIAVVSEAISVDAKFNIWFLDVVKGKASEEQTIEVIVTSDDITKRCCAAVEQFHRDRDANKLNAAVREFTGRLVETMTSTKFDG